jgi:competence protein ComEC
LSIAWGFALSVSATAGIIMLTPYLLDWSQRTSGLQRFPPIVIAAAMLTIAAQLATLPVLIAMGVPLSLGSVPANVLAMPMVPFITVGGLLSAVIAPLSIPVAHALAWASSWPATWIATLAHYFSQWPALTGLQMIAAVLIVVLSVVAITRLSRINFQPLFFVIPIVCLAFLVTRVNSSDSWVPENWFMAMCDVGQGDAIVLKSESERVIVVDVGPTPELINECLEQLNVHQIDAVIISHFHRDHVGGLAGVFHGRSVASLYVTPHQEPLDQYEYAASVIPSSLPMEQMKSGQVWTIGDNQLRVLWPDRILQAGSVPNNASVVILFDTRDVRILLTGDIEREAQAAIMRAYPHLNADIVKVPHHGSPNLDPEFSEWAGGDIALFSVGHDNDYGHPSEISLREWGNSQQFRTDQQGSIALHLNPQGWLQVSTEY